MVFILKWKMYLVSQDSQDLEQSVNQQNKQARKITYMKNTQSIREYENHQERENIMFLRDIFYPVTQNKPFKILTFLYSGHICVWCCK